MPPELLDPLDFPDELSPLEADEVVLDEDELLPAAVSVDDVPAAPLPSEDADFLA